MIYLFDSSALVAHALQTSGATAVRNCMDEAGNELLLSALSLFELAGVLKQNGATHEIEKYWQVYRDALEVVPVSAELAVAAWKLREKVGQRIPMADAIIAATALARGATLVHRDRHLATIPDSLMPQLRLPSE